jgi:hypothetical protein
MPMERLRLVVGSTSNALAVTNWRPYAVHAPFVLRRKYLKPIFSRIVELEPKLEHDQKHFGYSIASAELGFAHGITGNLRLSRYNSFHENWNFVDRLPYNPCNESIDVHSEVR